MKLTWRNIVIAAGAACIAVGIFMGLWKAWEQAVVRGWPQVPGRVEARSIASSSTLWHRQRYFHYWPEITYAYQVAGRTYRSSTVYPERAPDVDNGDQVRAIVYRYRVGGPVGVYYDPADPQRSALIPDIPSGEFLALILAGIIVIVLAFTTLGPLRRMRSTPDTPR